MRTRVTRPDLRKPDQYQIQADESMLVWMEEGLICQIDSLYRSLDSHQQCDLRSMTGCKVRENFLIEKHGSIAEANRLGFQLGDCTEDIAWVTGEISRLMDFLYQARELRASTSMRDPYEVREAEQKLAEIKGEVIHREAVAREETSEVPRLTDEVLNQLDTEREAEAQAQLRPEAAKGGLETEVLPRLRESDATTTEIPKADRTAEFPKVARKKAPSQV